METERNFGVGASFRGLDISAGGSRKLFSERETTRVVVLSKEIFVEARATTSFYQKRYNLLVEVWFWQRVPGWPEHTHFGVGQTGAARNTVKRTAQVSILAEEYTTLLRRLSGTTALSAVAAPRRPDGPPINRQFANITQRAKIQLAVWGIRG